MIKHYTEDLSTNDENSDENDRDEDKIVVKPEKENKKGSIEKPVLRT